MTLSHEAVTSFQSLYQKKLGVLLDYQEAETQALKELRRFSLVYRPIPKKDKGFFNKLRNNNNGKLV